MAKIDIVIPRLGLTMEWGRVVQWFFNEGDEVKQGQPLFALETEKATVDVEAQDSGRLNIFQDLIGEELPVGTSIGFFDLLESSTQELTKQTVESTTLTDKKEIQKDIKELSPMVLPQQVLPKQPIKDQQVKPQLEAATPIISPTQVLGGIKSHSTEPLKSSKVDLESKTFENIQPTIDQQVAGLTGIRQLIAKHMAASVHTTAPVTLTIEVDATQLVQLREGLKQSFEKSNKQTPSYNDFFIALLAKAIQSHPQINASLTEEGIVEHEDINIGLAVDTPRGLLVPVIHQAQSKRLLDIAAESNRLIELTQNGKILPDDLHGGTFTVTNLGLFDIDAFTPIINLPECAILGVGSIRPQPVATQDLKIEVRDIVILSLTFDHRVIDGAPAARFLQYLKQLIEQPIAALSM